MADSVLAEIVAAKRIDVAQRFGSTSPDGLRTGVAPTTRSLRAALARPGARFIMEVKRASPSGHLSTVEPADAARAYAGVADAISVLTDAPYFQGSLDDLRMVRSIFDGPILAKDFVVDPRQLIEARGAGADAALAMLSVLSNEEAAAVYAEAARLGMDVITEVHDEAELARATALGATIIGINNRDLKSLKTDLAVTERLAPMAPQHSLLIAESGIAARGDVERLAPLVDAFLVGSSLMAAPDVGEAARALVHGRVKVCGLSRAEDVAIAATSGATHAGFILVPGSPRAVTLEQLPDLIATAREHRLKPVVVTRDDAALARAAANLHPHALQLHGSESAAHIAELRSEFAGEIWSVRGEGTADRRLFDHPSGGGSGQTVDWSVLTDDPALATGFLAGGINPANAADAARVGAYGLDLSSGIEASPGIKDQKKMTVLFDALRPRSRGSN